jgi:hypothetical protein
VTKPARTKKQREIVEMILRAADSGSFLTIKEIHAGLSYTCAYGSLRTSLKFLVGKGILERRKAGSQTLLIPTAEAYAWFRAGGV